MFLGSIKAPVPSSRPAMSSAVARKPCQIRRAAAGPQPRAAAAWGEHGEDPRSGLSTAPCSDKEGHLMAFTPGNESASQVETIVVEDRKLVHRLLPVVRRFSPVGGDIAQRQPDQLARRVIGREMTTRLDDLAQPGIDALDPVGGVDHPPDRRRKCKERDHPVPRPPPGRDDSGEFLPPLSPASKASSAAKAASALAAA